MSATLAPWSFANVNNESEFATASQSQRRSSDGDQQQLCHQFAQDGSIHPPVANRSDLRPHSSNSNITPSNLTGAMGDTSTPTHPPPPSDVSYHEQSRTYAAPYSVPNWASELTHSKVQGGNSDSISYYVPPTISASSIDLPGGSNLSYSHYNEAPYHNYNHPDLIFPESSGIMSATYPNLGYPVSRSLSSASQSSTRPSNSTPLINPIPGSPVPAPVRASQTIHIRDDAQEEIRNLRIRIRELELHNGVANQQLEDMQMAMRSEPGLSRTIANPGGSLPPPSAFPVAQSFRESWVARTNARVRAFCSLNRAGNALCAWHDSRRERRAHAPRMAPPGYLNCGCTYEEALFEESLARHSVGSYHPGESVRMDPALRNPLLKLLQQRYGYRDGDFEWDPVSGSWMEGEDAVFWETRAQAGSSRRRVDDKGS